MKRNKGVTYQYATALMKRIGIGDKTNGFQGQGIAPD